MINHDGHRLIEQRTLTSTKAPQLANNVSTNTNTNTSSKGQLHLCVFLFPFPTTDSSEWGVGEQVGALPQLQFHRQSGLFLDFSSSLGIEQLDHTTITTIRIAITVTVVMIMGCVV